MSDTTTIQLKKTTKAELDKKKLVPGESYDNLIRRLLECDGK